MAQKTFDSYTQRFQWRKKQKGNWLTQVHQQNYYYYYIHLTAFFQNNLGRPAPERYNILDFTGARDDGVAVASAGPYAHHLHLTPDRQPRQYLTTHFLQAGCPSCRPTNSVKALKASSSRTAIKVDEKSSKLLPDVRQDFGHAVLNDGVRVDDTVKQVLAV